MKNLVPAAGFREVFSIKEVADRFQVTRGMVEGWIRRGHLRKGGKGSFCLMLKDVHEFQVGLNNGSISIRARK